MQGLAYPPPFHEAFLPLFAFRLQILIELLARVKNVPVVTVITKGLLDPIRSIAQSVIVC